MRLIFGLAVLCAPAILGAAPVTVTVNPDGTFTPKLVIVPSGATVRFEGLGHADSVATISPASSIVAGDVCFAPNRVDPTYANPRRRAFGPADSLTGPARHGFSGIWALGPQGSTTGLIAIPSVEATRIAPLARICPDLDSEIELRDENDVVTAVMKYQYELEVVNDGEDGEIDCAVFAGGVTQLLCTGSAHRCNANGRACVKIDADGTDPTTVPPGTYLSGLMTSTYENPDITGVVLRYNWKDLQYDDDGVIRLNTAQLDRELERAIAHGKYVTLDVRAGAFGTPDWIFTDYLDPTAPVEVRAPWCTTAACSFVSAPPDAGLVHALEFTDYYDTPFGVGCGFAIRIGSPVETHYRDLYSAFIAELAAHVASDTRWFQTVAHVKVSGANLQSSEAELPHHCDDLHINTAYHQVDPKVDFSDEEGDRVLDVFKTLGDPRTTVECTCNPQLWFDAGYTPEGLYDYYAHVEGAIMTSFFGRKSLGYQLMQDGFPRADARADGSFLGDHLYREDLEADTDGVMVNAGLFHRTICNTALAIPLVTPFWMTYCSLDGFFVPWAFGSGGTTFHVFMDLEPLRPAPGYPFMTYRGIKDYDGVRYPAGNTQAIEVMDQAALGRFTIPDAPDNVDPVAGKLFVPQHSGIQPLSQERVALGYGVDEADSCDQQLTTVLGLGTLPVADFPIGATTNLTTLFEDRSDGCPNHWIVNEGRQENDVDGVTLPPQITGYQTSNRVRRLETAESALMNLTHNTNAVFIELYEDLLWRIATVRGTGPLATPMAARETAAYCDPTSDLCYSKSLSQWADELHWRRAQAAARWGTFDGVEYPALADPFATAYETTVTNDSPGVKVLEYINPGRCDPTLVDVGNDPTHASALGKIVVLSPIGGLARP